MVLSKAPEVRRTHRLAGRDGMRLPAPFQGFSTGLVLLFLALLIYPIFRLISTLFWSNGHFDISAFSEFAHEPGVASSIVDTLIVVGISAAIAVILGGAIAYLNERTDARMGVVTDMMPILPFLIPPLAGATGWVLLLSPTSGYANWVIREVLGVFGVHLASGPLNIFSWPALIFVYTIYMVPFTFLMITSGLRSASPDLEEQSHVCGAGSMRTFFRVVLPSIAPSVGGALLLAIWSGFGLYSVPTIIAQPANIHIMIVQIVTLLDFNFPPQYGPAVVLSLIIMAFIAIAWYAQNRVLSRSRYATTGGRARRSSRTSLGAWKWPIRLLLLLYMVIVAVLPVVALLLVTLNGFWTTEIHWAHLSLSPFFQSLFDNAETLLALKDSVEVAVAAATIGVLVASMISVFLVKSRRRAARAADGMLKLPTIVSHLILAIGFVLAFAGGPFHLGGTWWLLLIAYLALFMPQATLVTDSASRQVGKELSEASYVSGARGWRTYRRVYMPLMLSAMAVGWALIFVQVLGDLEVSSIIAGTGNPTIGSQTLILYNSGGYAAIASLGLALVVLTSVVVGVVLWLSRRIGRWSQSESVSVMATPP
jgi:iron(III) transport system permease protein